MNSSRYQSLKRLSALFEIPEPDPPRLLHRIELMERNVMLPAKAAFIGMILYSFRYSSLWVGEGSSLGDITVETVQYIFWFYILFSGLLALPVLNVWRVPLAVVQWTAVTSSLVDGLAVAALALITGGSDSVVFWLFVCLIVRNAVSVPPGASQVILNFAISLCYVAVAVLDATVTSNLDEATRRALDWSPHEDFGQPFFLRLSVLWLMAGSCYGVQAFMERQRLAVEDAAEFAAREGQLRSAGRLSAEFAHQIKNPLAIINNAAFSLQRVLDGKDGQASQQIAIIREEVARADRVITQIMGYAQLSEGRVEKLNVIEELDRAIAQVFPPAVPTRVRVQRDYGHGFQPLLMQRGHLAEIFVNLLQNAREVLGDTGTVTVAAASRHDYAIEVSVSDDGPGIAPELVERIFEAYFTTKEKGTGLGLSIVKHNVELYGGEVRLESRLGKGAKFTVIFPAKTLPKILKR